MVFSDIFDINLAQASLHLLAAPVLWRQVKERAALDLWCSNGNVSWYRDILERERKERDSWLTLLLLVFHPLYFQIQDWEWFFIRLFHFTYDKTETQKWLSCSSPTLKCLSYSSPDAELSFPLLWTSSYSASSIRQKRDHRRLEDMVYLAATFGPLYEGPSM